MRIFDAAAGIRRLLLLALLLPAAAVAQSVTQPDATAQPAGGPLNRSEERRCRERV